MLSKLEKKIKYQFLANKLLKNIIFFKYNQKKIRKTRLEFTRVSMYNM